jgi:hypothetical protein
MRSRGPRLGEILERRGALTRDQLLRGLRNQKVVGGKLGTCLLEIDALPEEALLDALIEQQGVPGATPEDLRSVPADVLKVVPAKVARANFAVPFRATAVQVHVAMIDGRDLHALDELSFVTGRRVHPHVASEMRVLEALDRYYGEECPPRFVKLLDRINRSRFLWAAREEAPKPDQLQWDPRLGSRRDAGEPAFTAPVPLPELPLAPPARADAIAAEPAPESSSTPRPPHEFAPRLAPPAPPPAPTAPPAGAEPLTLASAERRLHEPEDADAVAAALVEFAADRLPVVALFQVRRSVVTGWLGSGIDEDRLESYRLRLDQPSLFFALNEGAPLHRGPLAELPAHVELNALLGKAAVGDLAGLPLRVRGRLVAVLLVASAAGPMPAAATAELQRLVTKASLALELCVMRNKLEKA